MQIWFKTHPFFPLRWAPPTHCWKLASNPKFSGLLKMWIPRIENHFRNSSGMIKVWFEDEWPMCHSHVPQAIRLQIIKMSELEAFLPSIFPGFVAFLEVFFQLLLYWFCTVHRLLRHLALLTSNVKKNSVENRVASITVMEIKTGKCCQRNLQFQELLTRSKMLRVFGVSVPFWTLWGDCRGKVHKESAKNSFVGFVASCWPNVILLD